MTKEISCSPFSGWIALPIQLAALPAIVLLFILCIVELNSSRGDSTADMLAILGFIFTGIAFLGWLFNWIGFFVLSRIGAHSWISLCQSIQRQEANVAAHSNL